MKIKDFETRSAKITDYDKITRAEFASLVVGVIDGAPMTSTDKKWVDETGEFKNMMTTLRLRYNFSWKDQF